MMLDKFCLGIKLIIPVEKGIKNCNGLVGFKYSRHCLETFKVDLSKH